MNRIGICLLLGSAVLLPFGYGHAGSMVDSEAREAVIIGGASRPVIDLAPHLTAFVDPTGNIGIADLLGRGARFERLPHHKASFGYTNSAVWLRFDVRSVSDEVADLIVELGSARPGHLTWHVVDGGRVERSASAGSADLPRRAERLPTLALSLPPGEERTILLRVESDTAMLLPLRIGLAGAMREEGLRRAAIDSLEIGFCVAIMLLSLLLASVRRARLYLHLALVAAGYTSYFLIFHGYVIHMWPQAPIWFERQALGIATGLALLAFAFFNRRFLGSEPDGGSIRLWLGRASLCLPSLIIVSFLFLDFRQAVRLIDPLAVSGILAGLALVLARRRLAREELWFAVAWGGLGLTIILLALQFKGLLPVIIPIRTLQFLIVPSILTAFFLAVLVRQQVSDAEEQQRRAERQAYDLVGNIAAGTYEALLVPEADGQVTPDFRFLSQQFLEMFDLVREVSPGDPSVIASRIHPEDRESLAAANAEAFVKRRDFRWEGRVIVRGETKWFLIVSSPRVDRRNDTLWTGLVTDITAEKQARDGLRQTLENLPVAVACGTLGDSPRIALVNEQFIGTFGYTIDDAPTVERWAELAYPDERYRLEIMGWWQNALEQAARQRGKVGSREVRVRCKDGSERECIVSATLLPGGPVVTFLDVTERNRVARELDALRQSREKSAYELTENMPAGTYVVTLAPRPEGGVDLAFRFASSRFLELFGLSREALMANPGMVIDSIHPQDRESMNASNARAYATGSPFHWEGRVLLDRQTRWMEIRSNPRVAPDGVTVWEGVVNDVTSRVVAELKLAETLRAEKQLRAEAEQLRREAESAHEAKSLFLARMSHEIRTPLSALVSLSQAMWMRGEQENLDPGFNGFLNRIRSGGQYLNLLLRNVLNVSAAQSGRVPVNPSEFYLADWAEDIRNILEPIAGYHRGSITWSLPGDDEARVRTDQMRLTQIALNLGENALKFGNVADEPVRISLRIRGGCLLLIVEDRGPGIPSEKRDAVFEEFARAGSGTSPLDDGVGLGLSVVKINTRLLGGSLRAESASPHGMRFTVQIPCMADDSCLEEHCDSPEPIAATP